MTSSVAEQEDGGWGLPLHPEAILLSEEEMARAATLVSPVDDPELSWEKYLRSLVLVALRKGLKHRNAVITIGPELSPEDPRRLLALNGRATQLVCISTQAETVVVPLTPWRDTASAPQLLLLAKVDEDQGTVQFLGVLNAVSFVGEVRLHQAAAQTDLVLSLKRFGGGLERLLRWVNLLELDALPRAGLDSASPAPESVRVVMAGLQQWLEQFLRSQSLIPLPVMGTRGGMTHVVRLINPEVKPTTNGSAVAQALCATPSIWVEQPLTEILLIQDKKVLWQLLATRQKPIVGPVKWPLSPLLPHQRMSVRLRPFGALGGAYAELILVAPDADIMRSGEQAVDQLQEELMNMDIKVASQIREEKRAAAVEARARQWIALNNMPLEKVSDG
jgi:hypothetical protein